MIQFKEASAKQTSVRLSLLTYPVLMAADVLLHDIHDVPVGNDQSQHVELARDVAVRFNHAYGDTFVVPKAVNPEYGTRVMDLTDPAAKMGKSNASQAGTIQLLDPPDTVARKVRRAVTDRSRSGLLRPGAPTGRLQPAGDPGRLHRCRSARAAIRWKRRAEGRGRRRGDRHDRPDPGPVRGNRRGSPTAPWHLGRRRGAGLGAGSGHAGPGSECHRTGPALTAAVLRDWGRSCTSERARSSTVSSAAAAFRAADVTSSGDDTSYEYVNVDGSGSNGARSADSCRTRGLPCQTWTGTTRGRTRSPTVLDSSDTVALRFCVTQILHME